MKKITEISLIFVAAKSNFGAVESSIGLFSTTILLIQAVLKHRFYCSVEAVLKRSCINKARSQETTSLNNGYLLPVVLSG